MLENKQYKADFLLFLVVTFWGSTFPIMKMILVDIDPYFFIALRFTVASLCLVLIFHKHLKQLDKRAVRKGFFLGLLLLSGYSFQVVGLQYTSASRSGFITGLAVVLVPIILAVFLKEIPPLLSWVGVVLAVAGLFMLTNLGDKAINTGDYLTILCAVSFALQIVLLSRYITGENPVLLAVIQMLTVAGGAYILAVLNREISSIGMEALWVIVYTGIMATAFAYLIQSYAQQYTPPTHAALIFTLEPVMGAVFSYLILGERIGRGGVMGGILIVAGMIIAEFKGITEKMAKRRRNNEQN